jgi:putative FmdB family regulatory protein
MPIYEYECGACGKRREFIQKFSDSPKRKCPACGALKLKRLMSAAAFHLKGNGWYVTDFRDKDKKKGDEKSAGKDGGKDTAKDTAKDSAKDSAGKSTGKDTEKSTSTGKKSDSSKSAS